MRLDRAIQLAWLMHKKIPSRNISEELELFQALLGANKKFESDSNCYSRKGFSLQKRLKKKEESLSQQIEKKPNSEAWFHDSFEFLCLIHLLSLMSAQEQPKVGVTSLARWWLLVKKYKTIVTVSLI